MAAKDIFHDGVKTALQKDGWTITDDPLHLRLSGVIDLYIDLGAEKLLAAQKEGKKIALEDAEPDRTLYLAIPLDVYNEFFTLPFIQSVILRSQLKLIIYDPIREEIAQWHP
ncbi:element excision factor XisH family protein [Candidatus Entotheonella palauensis]|uniref:Fatty-acid oxidation protein subunit alpha n=1 Tax=Candidatus Entotheonella gemina TaxID=1429439 RepID=W4M1S8_9BACT|nr:element excision factor XisH family protein [Candidatus Entotheonella palauensis]ETX04108.1 MAG: hypothetical protein ETSY2_30705 [Candidatus Entotheonella gemina]